MSYKIRMLIPVSNPYDFTGRKNRYAADCDRCGQPVDEQAGVLVKDQGSWAALHFSCAPQDIQDQASDQFSRESGPPVYTFAVKDGEGVIYDPPGFVDRNWYQVAQRISGECCSRRKGSDGRWYSSFPIREAGLIQEMYEEAGLSVAITDSLREFAQADLVSREQNVEAANDRANAIDRILHDVGMESQGIPFSLYDFQRTGIDWLARNPRALLADDQGLGKAIPFDTKVLCAGGWREIGCLKVGDLVIGSDGKATLVKGVYPQGVKSIYTVTMNDGSKVEACDEHYWSADYRKAGRHWTRLRLTTEQLRTRPKIGTLSLSKTPLYCPMLSAPVDFVGSDLPIDAYVTGGLLANGSMANGCTPALIYGQRDWADVKAALSAASGDLDFSKPTFKDECSSVVVSIRGLIATVRSLGMNVLSGKKRIPPCYMVARIEDRKRLLQGLMDADGSCSATNNRLTYHTTSEGLAADVAELVEGLGGLASYKTYDRSDEGKGIEFSVRIRVPAWITPFTVKFKASRYNPGRRAAPARKFASVEYSREAEAVCIAVDAPDRLFVTEHCILTHNTLQSCAAIADEAPAVIVAPLSLLENWAREMARWRPERAGGIRILDKTSANKRSGAKGIKAADSFKSWPGPNETWITTYTRLPSENGPQGLPAPGTFLICDEAQNLKTLRLIPGRRYPSDKSSNRAARFFLMSEAVREAAGAVWLLSGTPLMNDPSELWSVLEQANLATDAFGNWQKFVDVFGVPRGRYALLWKEAVPNTEAIVPLLRRVMLRREKWDVLKDLPDKTYEQIIVPIDSDYGDRLASIEAGVMDWLQDQDVSEASVQADVKALRAADRASKRSRAGAKLTSEEKSILLGTKSHQPGFEQLALARRIIAQAKVPALLGIVSKFEEAGEPVIVFSAHVAPLEILAKRPGWSAITGKVKASKRQEIVDEFQAGQMAGVAGQIRAAGVGLTLTRAATVIFLDKDWTPAGNVQAEDRAHRIGQMRTVNIISLVADHAIDRAVNAILDRKARLIRATISAGRVGAEAQDEAVTYLPGPQAALPEVHAFDPVAAGMTQGPIDPERALAESLVQAQEERQEDMRLRWQLTPELVGRPGRRGPHTPDEAWAANAMASLSEADGDHASIENGVGFSMVHTVEGHRMDLLLRGGYGLTDGEWELAIDFARYHQSQLDPRPSASNSDLAKFEKAKKRAMASRRRAGARAVEEDGISVGATLSLPDGLTITVVGRLRKRSGQQTVWRVQSEFGEKFELTTRQIRGYEPLHQAESMVRAPYPHRSPPPPGTTPPPDSWGGGGTQQTLWNPPPPWYQPVRHWPSGGAW